MKNSSIKTILGSCICIILGAVHGAHGQIITFDFTGAGTSRPTVNQPWTTTSSIDSNLTITNGFQYGATATPGVAGPGLDLPQSGATDPDNALAARNWGASDLTNALANDEYFTVSLHADSGFEMNLDGATISMTLQRLNNGGPSSYGVFSSVDGFALANTLDSGGGNQASGGLGTSAELTPVNINLTLSGAQYSGLTGAVEFRIYAHSSNPTNGTLALTSFEIGSGSSVTPIPEPSSIVLALSAMVMLSLLRIRRKRD